MTIEGLEVMSETWKPRLITGGKEIIPPSQDWLWDLDIGTVFFCKSKKTPILLHIYVITAKLEQNGNRMMRLENPENPEQYIPVDTRDFSREYTFHMRLEATVDGPSNSVGASGLETP